MIDHVRNVTGQERIQYVGFSMGTTGFMVAANERPEEMAGKVEMAHLLAPVAYIEQAGKLPAFHCGFHCGIIISRIVVN